MKPPEGFSEKVRARVTELTGADPGPFRIGSYTPGTDPNTTEAQLVEAIAQSIARRGEWTEGPPESSQPQIDVREYVKNL